MLEDENVVPPDPNIAVIAASLPPFPTWPPPSGGAPSPNVETGPVLSPHNYGANQPTSVGEVQPPPPAIKGSVYFDPPDWNGGGSSPGIIPPRNGQNQNQQLPPWPVASFNTLPHLAPPVVPLPQNNVL
jgi:hypothetical protein